MRINQNRNDILGAYQKRKLEKVEKFPSDKVNIKGAKKSKKGIVIDISDHARKIKMQNKDILKKVLSEEMGSKEAIRINQSIQNGDYNKKEVISKIADRMIEEAELFMQ
ncbi:MAG: hypothetical protein ACLFSQ_04195 [Candidatus Zixiibacteriota bacterium]